MGLACWSWDFQGVYVTQFCRISWGESLFSLEFPRLRWQTWTYHCLIVVKFQVKSEFFCFFLIVNYKGFCPGTLSKIVSNLSNFLPLDPASPKTKTICFWFQMMKNDWLEEKFLKNLLPFQNFTVDLIRALFFSTSINFGKARLSKLKKFFTEELKIP